MINQERETFPLNAKNFLGHDALKECIQAVINDGMVAIVKNLEPNQIEDYKNEYSEDEVKFI